MYSQNPKLPQREEHPVTFSAPNATGQPYNATAANWGETKNNNGGDSAVGGGQTVYVSQHQPVDESEISLHFVDATHQTHPWHYGLCQCCSSCDACVESWFCCPCQLSRQCNMTMNGKAEIHWPYCVFLSIAFLLTLGDCVAVVFAYLIRDLTRKRYGIRGSLCSDFCTACCCTFCSVQQILLEMTVNNDFPGATCYHVEPRYAPQVSVEMV